MTVFIVTLVNSEDRLANARRPHPVMLANASIRSGARDPTFPASLVPRPYPNAEFSGAASPADFKAPENRSVRIIGNLDVQRQFAVTGAPRRRTHISQRLLRDGVAQDSSEPGGTPTSGLSRSKRGSAWRHKCHARKSRHPDLAVHAAALDSGFRGNDSVEDLILNDAAN